MPESPSIAAAKAAVQTAENLIHRRVSECYEDGRTHPSKAPLTLRDGMIIVDALIRVMEAIESTGA